MKHRHSIHESDTVNKIMWELTNPPPGFHHARAALRSLGVAITGTLFDAENKDEDSVYKRELYNMETLLFAYDEEQREIKRQDAAVEAEQFEEGKILAKTKEVDNEDEKKKEREYQLHVAHESEKAAMQQLNEQQTLARKQELIQTLEKIQTQITSKEAHLSHIHKRQEDLNTKITELQTQTENKSLRFTDGIINQFEVENRQNIN